jgi:hypothetical protein
MWSFSAALLSHFLLDMNSRPGRPDRANCRPSGDSIFWAAVFIKLKVLPTFWATSFTFKGYALIFTNIGLGCILGDFFKKHIWSPWGRCYDHNFLLFFPIFGEKIGVFLKFQCYDQLFQNFALF